MTSRIIFKSGDWTITQDPTNHGYDELVRFRCHNGRRCLLDQIAEWHVEGMWRGRRWVPRSPKVPYAILAQIEAHMRKQP